MGNDTCRVKGLRADLVILNEQKTDYLDEMQNLLTQLVQESPWSTWFGKSGGMFLLRAEGMADAARHLLGAVARVVLPGALGELSSQLERPASWHAEHGATHPAELRVPEPSPVPVPVPVPVLVPVPVPVPATGSVGWRCARGTIVVRRPCGWSA